MVGVIAILLAAAGASGAAAQQRDPFDPRVEPGGGAEGAPADEAGETQPTGQQPFQQPAQQQPAETGADRLAETGSEVEPWLAVAYALAALGAGAVVLSRTSRTPLARPPRRR